MYKIKLTMDVGAVSNIKYPKIFHHNFLNYHPENGAHIII